MRLLTHKESYVEMINFRKHLDVLITQRAALFITANTILFFVFRPTGTGFRLPIIIAALGLALMFNLFWLLIGIRTRGVMGVITEESDELERLMDYDGFQLHRKLVARPKWHVSVTRKLCITLPLLFGFAWVVFSGVVVLWS